MFIPFIVPLKDIKRVNNSWKTSPKIKEAARKIVVFLVFFMRTRRLHWTPICDVGWWERRKEGKADLSPQEMPTLYELI